MVSDATEITWWSEMVRIRQCEGSIIFIDGERVHWYHPCGKVLTDKMLPHSTELT